ncbi:TetR/AcrR family transcriptional regulator [Williamsia sp.]|uniref:TetR/AcrR family transcriptional regulator n=1 Tax=Williamsia sp. TaxID=1872085 RepID=UPI002F934B13
MTEQLSPRAQARIRTNQRILAVGRDHLAKYGAAALSLRAIARDLDLVSSAVYRYVASRDELLTMLVVDAYTELADEVTAAHDSAPANDHREQIRRSCNAFHDWAVSEPSRYALLYGSPVPGYQAPAEQTTEPGTRVVALLMRTIADAASVGRPASESAVPDTIDGLDFDSIRTEFDLDIDDQHFHFAISLWATVVGLTSLEVFGQFGAEPGLDLQTLFTLQIDGLLDRIGPGSKNGGFW